MKKHKLIFEFPDEESKNAFAGWFDNVGEQQFDPDNQHNLGFKMNKSQTIVVLEKFDNESVILKPNGLCEDCGKKATFGDDPSNPSIDEEDGVWLCSICYDDRERNFQNKQLQRLRDGKISQKK